MALDVKHCGKDQCVQCISSGDALSSVERYISRLCFRHVLFLLQRRLSASTVHGLNQKYQVRCGGCLKNSYYCLFFFCFHLFCGPILSPFSFSFSCSVPLSDPINLFRPSSYLPFFSPALSPLLSTTRWHYFPSLLPSQSHFL